MRYTIFASVLSYLALTLIASAADYDFADPGIVGPGDSAKGWDVISGEWAVVDGEYVETEMVGQAAAQDGNAFRAIMDTAWEIEDGIVEMKARHDAASSGANDAILLYRMEDDDNGYATRLQRDNYLTIGKITDGVYSHLKYTSVPVNADTVYTVTVELDGDSIKAYIDGVLKVEVNDGTYKKGRVGLCVGRSAFPIYFLSVHVEGGGVPEGNVLAIEPADKLATAWGEIKRRI